MKSRTPIENDAYATLTCYGGEPFEITRRSPCAPFGMVVHGLRSLPIDNDDERDYLITATCYDNVGPFATKFIRAAEPCWD